MLHILKFLCKPLKTEYLMILLGIKTIVMIFTVCWLMVVANAIAAATQQQHQQQQQQMPQTLNYKQQLQYQMQQHDKFQYQQQQQYYQQQQLPAVVALEHKQQQQQQQYLAVKPTQMLQTAASLVVDDGSHPETLALGQVEYSNGNVQRRRLGTRKRKRRPQLATAEDADNPIASNAPPSYWRGKVADDNADLSAATKSISTDPQDSGEIGRAPHPQVSFKRRKPSSVREPLAALETEQKLYEMPNKPETSTEGITNRNSANLKNILKNSGSLSLSEILQQKNLSLDDLLKGKQIALQALQTTAGAPPAKINHVKYPSFKANFKPNTPTLKVTEDEGTHEEEYSSKERSKLSASQRLKLFGSSSRPAGLQIGLLDRLTTRKRDGGPYTAPATTTTTTTTAKPPTTKIPLYKKILHQRPTLKPTFLLKNAAPMANAEPHLVATSWDSKEQLENKNEENVEQKQETYEEQENVKLMEDIEPIEEEEVLKQEDIKEISTKLPETTTWKIDTTMFPSTSLPFSTTTTTTSTTSSPKSTTGKITDRDIGTSTRRMFISTRGSSRTNYRHTTAVTNPATTSTIQQQKPTISTTTTSTTTPLPTTTTTTTTSTTTASSSTMNLTPKANLNLNTEDLRERIQETLLKNLIAKEDSYKKSPVIEASNNDGDDGNNDDDDLENFFEETVKPKTTKYMETSTITTRMKQYTPSFIYKSSATTTSSPAASTTPTENVNVIPDFDNVDDRTDLLELIEDRRSGNRLFKVLEQRNMTLEELIEHRKRGSSQLHLATIVESPSRFYPDKKVVLQDNMDIVTAFENFPHFNLLNLKSVKPDDIKTDSQGSSYFTSIIDIEPTDEVYKNRKEGQTTAAELDKDRTEKSLAFFPSWKSLALASLATSTNHKDAADTNPYFLQQPKMLLENNSEINDHGEDEDVYDIKEHELNLLSREDEDGEDGDDDDNSEDNYRSQKPIQAAVRLADRTAEAIENEIARAHDLVDLELSGHGFKRSPQAAGAMAAHSNHRGSFYTNMPPGIKSAIVASATIVLTALVTFMVIFAVCKWKQRRHRMTNIMKSYNAMKSKLPTIAATSTGALNAANSSTHSNSRRSSFREMQDLLSGSGLSVAATITTTSTGVSSTPIHNTTKIPTPSGNTSRTTVLASQSSKNINSICSYNTNNSSSNSNNSSNSNKSNSSSCALQPLQRQHSLLFHRSFNQNNNSNNEKATNLSILSGCNLLDLKRNNKMSGSTTSLSFSLTSGHNMSNSHINTMDTNSPEVQEYLFDTLRNSF